MARIRELAPQAGIRSNVIVGFPGETDEDFEELVNFVDAAALDVCGVFGYSDEDGTEAEGYEDKVPQGVIDERVDVLSGVTEASSAERAAGRVGQRVSLLVESVTAATDHGEADWDEWAEESEGRAFADGLVVETRAEHQGPESDGTTRLLPDSPHSAPPRVGDIVEAQVISSLGADLLAVAR